MNNETIVIPVIQINISIDGDRREFITQNIYTEDSVSKALTFIKEYYNKEDFDTAETITIEITHPKLVSWVSAQQ